MRCRFRSRATFAARDRLAPACEGPLRPEETILVRVARQRQRGVRLTIASGWALTSAVRCRRAKPWSGRGRMVT